MAEKSWLGSPVMGAATMSRSILLMLCIISCSKEEFGGICVIGCGGDAACGDGSIPHPVTLRTQKDFYVALLFLISFSVRVRRSLRNQLGFPTLLLPCFDH